VSAALTACSLQGASVIATDAQSVTTVDTTNVLATAQAGVAQTAAEALAAFAASHEAANDYTIDFEGATAMTLNGASLEVTGEGVSVSGSTAAIAAAGAYVISGVLDDGQIVVDAPDDAAVTLVLKGAQITSTSGAPIHVLQADRVLVQLAAGTENAPTDGDMRAAALAETDEATAALFSMSDLTILGDGTRP
jgi:hypothetical protein